jgi:hypothetical protein
MPSVSKNMISMLLTFEQACLEFFRHRVIALMMEAASSSEASANCYQTIQSNNLKTAIFILDTMKT